jgi:hypothetical protein
MQTAAGPIFSGRLYIAISRNGAPQAAKWLWHDLLLFSVPTGSVRWSPERSATMVKANWRPVSSTVSLPRKTARTSIATLHFVPKIYSPHPDFLRQGSLRETKTPAPILFK